jgi:hypothetical protein
MLGLKILERDNGLHHTSLNDSGMDNTVHRLCIVCASACCSKGRHPPGHGIGQLGANAPAQLMTMHKYDVLPLKWPASKWCLV